MEINLSPKLSTLAYDEVKEQTEEHQSPLGFEPELSLIVNMRAMNMKNSSAQIVKIGGKVTVSF